MFNKEKSLLLIIPLLLIGVFVFAMGATNSGWQKGLSAFTLHSSFLSDSSDGKSPPDYRFLINHKAENKEQQAADIVLPPVLREATEHRCGVLIERLDQGRGLQKFDVAYMMVCFDKYPLLFTKFFDDL